MAGAVMASSGLRLASSSALRAGFLRPPGE